MQSRICNMGVKPFKGISNTKHTTSSEHTTDDYQKISTKEFIRITLWTFKLIHSLDPTRTKIYVATSLIHRASTIGYSYLFALIIDALINTATRENANIRDMYPYFGVLLGFTVFTSVISLIQHLTRNYLSNALRPKIKQSVYTKLNTIGIQTLEQPSVNDKIHRAEGYLESIFPYLRESIEVLGSISNMIISLFTIFSFLPFFAPVIALSTIPYFLYDKKFRGKLYKLGYDNTEASRKASRSFVDLSSVKQLTEISITGSFGFLDEKYMGFQRWFVGQWLNILKVWRTGLSSLHVISKLIIYVGYILVFGKLIKGTTTVGGITFQTRMLTTFQNNLLGVIEGINNLNEASLRIRDIYGV